MGQATDWPLQKERPCTLGFSHYDCKSTVTHYRDSGVHRSLSRQLSIEDSALSLLCIDS